jgi:hypothetical protein
VFENRALRRIYGPKRDEEKRPSRWRWSLICIMHIFLGLYYCEATDFSGYRPPHCWGFEITHRHTTLGRTPLDEGSALRSFLYRTKFNIRERRNPYQRGIRTHNPANERRQTDLLDFATTGIGIYLRLRGAKHELTQNFSSWSLIKRRDKLIFLYTQYTSITHDLNIGYQNLGFPLHQNQEILITRQEFGDTLSYSKCSCINILVILYISTYCQKKPMCTHMLTFTDIRYAACLYNTVAPL